MTPAHQRRRKRGGVDTRAYQHVERILGLCLCEPERGELRFGLRQERLRLAEVERRSDARRVPRLRDAQANDQSDGHEDDADEEGDAPAPAQELLLGQPRELGEHGG